MKKLWLIVMVLGLMLLSGCKVESEFDRELKETGLLDDEGNYLYEVPITYFGTPYGSPATAIDLMAEVLEMWSAQFGGREAFIAHVMHGDGVTSIILDYSGTITADKAVFIPLGNDKYPIGTMAINMPVHITETGTLQRTEFQMSVAHELAHGYDYKNGLEPSAEFERVGAAAVSARRGEILPENYAETVAAFMIGQGRPVGDPYVREWLTAYFVTPYLPDGEAVAYNPDDWSADLIGD